MAPRGTDDLDELQDILNGDGKTVELNERDSLLQQITLIGNVCILFRQLNLEMVKSYTT
jgi:hypothetical protein